MPPREELPGADSAAWGGLGTYVRLMRRCWTHDPGDRPEFEAVIQATRGRAGVPWRGGGGQTSGASCSGADAKDRGLAMA